MRGLAMVTNAERFISELLSIEVAINPDNHDEDYILDGPELYQKDRDDGFTLDDLKQAGVRACYFGWYAASPAGRARGLRLYPGRFRYLSHKARTLRDFIGEQIHDNGFLDHVKFARLLAEILLKDRDLVASAADVAGEIRTLCRKFHVKVDQGGDA